MHAYTNMHYCESSFLTVCPISPRNMEMHFSHRGLSSEKRWFTVAECGCTHKLLSCMCRYCMFLWYYFCEPPTLFFLLTLEHSSLYNSFTFVSPHSTNSWKTWQDTTRWMSAFIRAVYHFRYMPLHLCICPFALTPNGDSVKPKPQLCMNQNNNPQRFLLPPFPDTLCDSFAVDSSTRENPLRSIDSPDTPTCRGVAAGSPSGAFQRDTLCVCTAEKDVEGWKTTEVSEDGWASPNPSSSVTHQLLNRLCCPLENDLRSDFPVMLSLKEVSRGLDLCHFYGAFHNDFNQMTNASWNPLGRELFFPWITYSESSQFPSVT